MNATVTGSPRSGPRQPRIPPSHEIQKTAPRRLTLWRIAPLFCAALACPIKAIASSHSDAPLIKQDPQANLTDVYAFVGTQYNAPSVHVLVSVRPFSDPGDGVKEPDTILS